MASTTTHADSPLAVLKASLASGAYSDLTLKCKGREFKVHKVIVCSQSKPLAAAMNGQFSESMTGVFEFQDEKPDTIDKMINFLYTGTYTKTIDTCASNNNATADGDKTKVGVKKGVTMTDSVELYIVGDKWDIPALKTTAKNIFEAALINDWDLESFITSLGLIYSQIPDEILKGIAIKRAGQSTIIIDQLLDSPSYIALGQQSENSQIGNDLLREYRQALKSQTSMYVVQEKYFCRNCKVLRNTSQSVDGILNVTYCIICGTHTGALPN